MNHRLRDHRGLTHLSRLRLLHAIHREPGRRLHEIAAEAELHVNTARNHLRALEAEGLVRTATVTSGGPGRPAIIFSPARRPGEQADSRVADEGAAEPRRATRSRPGSYAPSSASTGPRAK